MDSLRNGSDPESYKALRDPMSVTLKYRVSQHLRAAASRGFKAKPRFVRDHLISWRSLASKQK